MSEPGEAAPLIAIVDDQHEVRTTVGRGLECYGYKIHQAIHKSGEPNLISVSETYQVAEEM